MTRSDQRHPRHIYLRTQENHDLAMAVARKYGISQQVLFLSLFLDKADELADLIESTINDRPEWIIRGITENAIHRVKP